MTNEQKRVALVLRRLADAVENDPDDAEVLCDELEAMISELHSNDFFGTEGQCDPRGDFRNGEWSMSHVEGLDE